MVMENVGLVVMALYLAPEVSLESKELFSIVYMGLGNYTCLMFVH